MSDFPKKFYFVYFLLKFFVNKHFYPDTFMNSTETTSFETFTKVPVKDKSSGQQVMACVPILSLTSVNFDIDLPQKYTLSNAKSYAHSLKLTDPESLKRIKKMKACFSEQNKIIPFAPPSDEMVITLNHCFNKLTPDLAIIHKMSEKVIHANFFGTELFFSIFSKKCVQTAVEQTTFAPVYTRFLQEVYCGLPTDEQKDILIKEISENVFENAEKNTGKSFFIGCLVSADILDCTKVIELIKTMMRSKTNLCYECVYNILLFAGKKMEECYHKFEDDIINVLTAAVGNTDIKQRIRFMISDLLDARSNGWEVTSLIQNIVIVDESDEQNEKKEKEGTIDDMYDHSYLREYLSSESLPTKIDERVILDIMLSLELSSITDYDDGISILSALNDEFGEKFMSICIRCLNKSREIVDTPDNVRDFPYCVRTVGAIFCNLIVSLNVNPQIFGTDEFPFHIDVFTGMVDEFDRTNKISVLKKSEYLTSFKFRPKTYPHSYIVSELSDISLVGIFPLYSSMYDLFSMISNEEDPKTVAKFINIDLERSIVKSTAFIEYVTEIIVIQRPAKYQCLLELVSHRPMEALSHIECIGEFFKWKPEQVAAIIRNMSKLIRAELTTFKALELRPFHKIVCKYIE